MNKLEQEYNNEIDELSKEWKIDTNNISDWYHTFGELYKHRIHLFIALCKKIKQWSNLKVKSWFRYSVYMSKKHDDWSEYEWYFLLQVITCDWQISYHIPIELDWINYWNKCSWFAIELEKAKPWDWHTSDDVLERLLLI